MADIIKHQGVIEKVDGSHVVVRIIQTSACSACSVKSHCNASESKDKLIDVYNVISSKYQKGDQVTVCGTTRMGMQAVLWAFGIPFFVLLIALLLALHFTNGNEWMSAILCLVALIPYYFILYMYRNKFSKHFSFYIESSNN